MIETLWTWLPSVGSWTIRIGAFVVVPFRRPPEAARTWLLLFFVAPWIALPAYLAIGRPRHSPERRTRFAALPEVLGRTFAAALSRTGADGANGGSLDAPPRDETETLVHALARMPALDGNRVELLPDYETSIDRLVADIDAARRHVHLEYYILADDATGGRVMAAVERARARGVACRVLFDALGSWSSARAVEARLAAAGAEVHRILPIARRLRSSRLDLRNHRKIAVLDGTVAWTGSQNLVDATAGGTPVPNRELVVRLTGPGVVALQAVFLGDWYLETGRELDGADALAPPDAAPPPSGAEDPERVVDGVRLQTLPSGPDYPGGGVDTLFASLIHDARDEVVLVTPYFIPNRPLVHALCAAALAGVAVTLIVSRVSDSALVGPAQDSFYAELMESGVTVRRHEGAFLHAKHLRIDDRVSIIGSSNMDMRSFELNAEISLILYGAPVARALAAVETDLLRTAGAVDPARWEVRPLPRKLLENSARLFADLL